MKRAAAVFLAALAVRALPAQNPAWTATLLVQPFPSPFLADWQRNPQMAVLTVLYTGRGAQTFRVEAFARAKAGEVGRVISPPNSFAFGPTTELFTTTDLLTWNTERSNGRYVYTVQRTGRLPEGPLQLCARVLDQNNVQLTSVCTDVTIALPDPPQLIFPAAAAVVTGVQPVFQWTAVVVPPEIGITYRVHIAERGPQQTPATALAANPPVLDQLVSGAPLLTYPLTGLPLETGKEYVWQVEALDQTGLPITRGQGRSEIRTFTVGGPGRPPATLASFPDTLTLVPGLARLSGLAKAQVTETPFAYVLDGQAQLQLSGVFKGQIRVQLNGLTVDKRSTGAPVFTSGGLQGTLPSGMIPATVTGAYVRPTTIAYDTRSGFSLAASLALPGTAALPFSGTLQLTAAGISGRLTAGDTSGSSFAAVGTAPARLRVKQASVTLPGGTLDLSGTLELLGQDVGCAVGSGSVDGTGKVSASIGCRPATPLTLIPGVTRTQLALTAVSGSFTGDLRAGTSSYQLTASGQLALDAGGQNCGGSLSLAITNGSVTPGPFTPACDVTGTADLGWLALTLSNLKVQKLSYATATGLDFALQLDVTPSLPSMPAVLLPTATGVTVDRSGVTLPAAEVTVTRPAVSIAGFSLKVTRATLPAFTLSWQDWQAHRATGFAFGIDGSLSYEGAAGVSLPSCLTGKPLTLTGAKLATGALTASLADQSFSPACEVTMGGALTLAVDKVGGAVGIQFGPDVRVTQSPSISGSVVLPAFFACAAGTDRRLPVSAIALLPDGTVSGHVGGVSPQCPVTLPALSLTVTNAALDFAVSGGAQSAQLSGAATAHFSAGGATVSGTGTVGIDLIAAKLSSGSLSFAGPFELDLPTSPAVLAFSVGGATLDQTGLHVDGRAQLLLPGKVTVGATFDRTVINPQTVSLTSGKVLFDAPFSLEAGIGSSGDLTWKSLVAGAALDVTTGLRMDLPAQVSLGASGLAVSGTAGAHVIYGGKDLAGATAAYTADFALALAPARVTTGSVTLSWQGADLGSIDAQGFHPDLGALATQVLPAQLPLPTADIAYLQLRDAQGNLLVNSQTTATGVHITSKTGSPVSLVIPVLALGRGTAPAVNVSVDLTLDPTGRGVTSGTVGGTTPPTANPNAFDLSGAGIPFVADSVSYSAGVTAGFTLTGRIAMLGHRQAGKVTLALDGAGHLTGSVNEALTPPDSIPLVPGFGGLALVISQVTGSFGVSLMDGSPPVFDLTAAGSLSVGMGGKPYRAQATVEATNTGLKVSNLTLPTGADSLGVIDLTVARLGLAHLQIPALSLDQSTGRWHFDLLFDGSLQFPQLDSLALPAVSGVELTEAGFSIPQINLAQLSLPAVMVQGFTVTPLAFRTRSALTFNWFTGQLPSDWGFGFDLGLGFGTGAPGGLQGLELSVLNAGLAGGVFTGQIESPPLTQPIVIPGGSISAFGGSLGSVTQGTGGAARVVQGIGVTATGRYAYPPLLRCASAPGDTTVAVSAGISAAGRFAGTVTNVVPQCPVQLGPLRVQMTASTLTLADSGGAQTAVLAGTATLKLPAPRAPDSVTASGQLTVDLAHGRVSGGSLQLTQPFRWSVPGASPLVAFDVTAGRIDSSGFALSGSADLMLDASDSVVATLNNVLLSLADFSVKRGSLTVTNGFAVQAGLDASGALSWKLVPRGSAPPATGVLIAAPDTVTMDSSGLRLGGGATAAFAFGGKSYSASQMSVRFDSGFALGVSPVAVTHGRASLMVGTDTIAVIDRAGFLPGNVFGVLPVPDSIPLPSGDVAFVRLRDPQTNQVLVATGTDPQGLKITTTAPVPLVIPALAGTGQAPTVNVTFSLVVNRATFVPVSGTLSVSASGATPLFDLQKLGLPLDIERLAAVAASGGGYALQLDAKVELPASLASADLRFTNLTVTAQGLSGQADLGTYATGYRSGLPVVATAALGPAATVQFTGAHVAFGAGSQNSVQLSGTVNVPLFSAAGATSGTPIFFAGAVSPANGLVLTVDPSKQANATLPLGVATFTPQPVSNSPAIQVAASDNAFTLTLSGSLGFPTLAPQLAVTVQGLTVGTGGVAVAGIAVSGSAPQQLTLFGQTLTLKTESDASGTCPAVTASYASPVLTLALSGELSLFNNVTTFCGLKVGTDGSFSIAKASLLSQPVNIVPGVVQLTSLSIGNDPSRGPELTAQVGVTLPAPLGSTTPQQGTITIAKDGSITGGATIVLIDPATAKSLTVGDATVSLRGLDLVLDAANFRNSSVQAAASICIKQASCPVNTGAEIDLGSVSGNTLTPGLKIGFDGSVQVPAISIPHPITFDSTFLRLTLKQVHGAPASSGAFVIAVDGSVGLNLNAVAGGLDFTGLQISSDGHMKLDLSGITGGDLQIGQSVDISVTQVGYSAKDTTITVPDGSKPTGKTDPTGHSSPQTITVHSFLSFGASVSVVKAFSGGVRRVLVYRDAANNSHILVDSAHFNLPGVVDMQADLRYDQSGSGWNILVGGSATAYPLGDLGMVVVGNLGEDQGPSGPITRFGVFLAVQGLKIDLAPTPITISGIGGGLFINPTQADLLMVQTLCGLQDTSGLVKPPAAATFGMLLYGQASIVDANAASGQVLLTVTDQALLIDGSVTVLPAVSMPGVTMNGSAHLSIPIGQHGAAGDLFINVDYIGVVTINTDLSFVAYSASAWGIYGNVLAHVYGSFDAKGDMSIGPNGFFVEGSIDGEYTIWIATISGGFSTKLWWVKDAGWGAYVAFDVSASVLDGAVTATGTLAGALVNSPPISYQGQVINPGGMLVYASANLHVDYSLGSWDGTVWVQFQNGNLSAGFGDDPAMDAAIAAAKQQSQAMADASQQIQGAIDAAKAQSYQVSIPASELAAAYTHLTNIKGLAGVIVYGVPEFDFLLYVRPGTDTSYFSGYNRIMNQDGAPTDTTRITALAAAVPNELNLIQGMLPAVKQKLAAIQAQTTQLATTPPAPPQVTSPIQVSTAGANGVPTFTLNSTLAQQQSRAALQGTSQAALYESAVKQQVQAMEAGLAQAHAATSGTSSLLDFAERFDSVETMSEEEFARQVDFVLRRAQWARQSDTWLRSQQQAAATLIAGVPQYLASQNRCVDLRRLADVQSTTLSAWTGDPQWHQQFITDTMGTKYGCDPLYQTLVTDIGTALWYGTGDAGLASMSTSADSIYQALTQTAGTRLATIRSLHLTVSQQLAQLNQAQADLTGRLYDLYNRYLFWKKQPSRVTVATAAKVAKPGVSLAPVQTIVTKSTGTNLDDPVSIQARLTELGNEMAVPRLTGIQVSGGTTTAYMADVRFTWTATHPTGLTEFVFNEAPSSPQSILPGLLYSNGGSGTRDVWLFTTNPDQGVTDQYTFQAGVRGTAGYTGIGSAPYTVTFGALVHGVGPSSTVTSTGLTADNTPPSTPAVWVPDRATVTGTDGKPRTWTADPGTLEASWMATDNQSGIAEFDYALSSGTSTPASWSNAGGRTDITIPGLHLSGSTPTYVNVRARNGQGVFSAVGMSLPIYVDSTAPRWPVSATLAPPPVPGSTGTGPTATPVKAVLAACSVNMPPVPVTPQTSAGSGSNPVAGNGIGGAWNGGVASAASPFVMGPNAVPPVITLVSPTASDAESGVWDYWWRVDRTPDSTFDPTQWTGLPAGTSTVDASGGSLDYQRQFYVSVIARNHAGTASVPLVYGPVTIADPTPPSRAAFCAGMGTNALAAQFSGLAEDDETGIAGYQYRVRDAGTQATVRTWLTGKGAVDWTGVGTANPVSTATLALTNGHSYYLDVRALNNQGMAGDVVVSGPVFYDGTPPPTPTATATIDTAVELTAQTPLDPESGQMGLQYAVGTVAGAGDVVPWQTLRVMPAATHRLSIPVAKLLIGDYYVSVRSVNTVGVPSATATAKFTVAPQAKSLPVTRP